MSQNENRLFGCHFEMVRIFYLFFFCCNMVVTNVYVYGVEIIKQFWWASGFLRGVPWNTPLTH